MRELSLLLSNYLLFILLACGLAAMQASLWYHIVGITSAPYFWLLVLIYWTLHRSWVEAIVMCYLVTFALVTMSGIPLDMSFAVLFSVFTLIYLLKDRVLWSGLNSFILASGIGALLLPIFIFIFSYVFEDRPIQNFRFFDWLIRGLLTSASAMPFYFVFTWLDKVTFRHVPTENESEVL